jgi:hypothetical protein
MAITLSPEQKQTVTAWVAAGDNLSNVQKKLMEQFKVSMTYMDVRFLVDDLGLELKNATPKADASDVTKAPFHQPAAAPHPDQDAEIGAAPADDADQPNGAVPTDEFVGEDAAAGDSTTPAGTGAVSIELDRIMRPGTAVSGSVTFSDGVSGKWALDQYGRLMLDTGKKGYQPSAPDVQTFQRELQAQLQRQGY